MLILVKFVDDLISSTKSIHTLELNYKKVFLFTILKTAIFLLIVNQVSNSNTLILILATLSSGIGSAIPVFLASRKKDKMVDTWRYNIKCIDVKEAYELKDILESYGLECVARENVVSSKETVTLEVISSNMDESSFIVDYIPKGRKVSIDKNIESFIKK